MATFSGFSKFFKSEGDVPDNPEINDCCTDYPHDNPIDSRSVCDPGTHHPDVSCRWCETGIYELTEE